MSTEQDVQRYAELNEAKTQIDAEQADIKARLRDSLDMGSHDIAGLTVTISNPSRKFNPKVAATLLPEAALTECAYDGYDPKKLKRYLSPELLDMAMESGTGGTGDSVVKIS